MLPFIPERNLCVNRCKTDLLLQDVFCAPSCKERDVLEMGTLNGERLPAIHLRYSKRCVRLADAYENWSMVRISSALCKAQ